MSDSFEASNSTTLKRRESAFAYLEREHRKSVLVRWVVFLAFPIVGAMFIYVSEHRRTPEYLAVGRMRLVLGIGALNGRARLKKREFSDEMYLLTSQQFRARVVESLGAADRAKLLKRKARKALAVPAGGKQQGDGVSVVWRNDSTMFTVSDRNADPQLAAALVNATIEVATRYAAETALERGKLVASFYAPQLRLLKETIERQQKAEDALNRDIAGSLTVRRVQLPGAFNPVLTRTRKLLKRGKNVDGSTFSFERQPAGESLASLKDAAEEARLESRLARARVEVLESLGQAGGGVSARDRLEAQAMAGLRTQLAQAEATYGSMLERFGENNPELLARRAQIRALQQEVEDADRRHLAGAESDAQEAEARADALGKVARAEQARVAALLMKQRTSAIQELQLALNLTLLEDIRQRVFDGPIAAALNAPLVDVIDLASVPAKPDSDWDSVVFSVQMCALSVLGIMVAIVLTLRRLSRWTVFDLEYAAELPVLALARSADKTGDDSGARTMVSAELAEPVRDLRDALYLTPEWRGKAVVAFTSATRRQGGTSVAVAFAALLARDGKRVLLIDADLYHPELHRYVGVGSPAGLTNVLHGRMTLAEAVRSAGATGPGSFDVLVSGPVPPDPAQVLQSMAMRDLLREARLAYDYVVLDTAGVEAGAGLIDSQQVDAMYVICRFGQVEPGELRRACARLRGADFPLMGIFANGIPYRAARKGFAGGPA